MVIMVMVMREEPASRLLWDRQPIQCWKPDDVVDDFDDGDGDGDGDEEELGSKSLWGRVPIQCWKPDVDVEKDGDNDDGDDDGDGGDLDGEKGISKLADHCGAEDRSSVEHMTKVKNLASYKIEQLIYINYINYIKAFKSSPKFSE